MQTFLVESLKGILHYAMLNFLIMSRQRDGLLHHYMLLQILLLQLGQILLLWSVFLLLWSLLLFRVRPREVDDASPNTVVL
jgi:hypothetical protein